MATSSRNDRAAGNRMNEDVLTVILPSENRNERRSKRKHAKHDAPSAPIVALLPEMRESAAVEALSGIHDRPASDQPADAQSADDQPADDQPAVDQLVDAQSLVERLAEAERDERADLLLEVLAADSVPDLAGADLRELDLAGAAKERATRLGGSPRLTLDGADLSGAILSGARLAGASFRGARLDDALMVGTDLRGADLAGASLRSAHLSGADLTRADLSFCDFRGASLLTAELANAVATGADLRETLLHSANLTGAMLRGVDLRWARLNGARLVNVDLRGVRFGGARLTLADLSGARVSSSTDFSFAFLHWTRLDRVALTRGHLGGGIGESVSDHSLARDTYLALLRHFAGDRRCADARWAYSQASSMGTATHRPDRARKYYPRDWASTEDRNATDRHRRLSARLRDIRSTMRHSARWLAGQASRLTTDHGTSFRRIAGTLTATWLSFAALFQATGGVFDIQLASQARSLPTQWLDALLYSATAITPIDAYPLVASSSLGHAAAMFEGVVGMVLFGALGYVAASRSRRGCG